MGIQTTPILQEWNPTLFLGHKNSKRETNHSTANQTIELFQKKTGPLLAGAWLGEFLLKNTEGRIENPDNFFVFDTFFLWEDW